MKSPEKQLPLRQRKQARTRAQIMEASQRLFAEQGYEHTTLEQICEVAEVSVPTLLAYFESKDRLALAGSYDQFEEFRQAIEDPERDQETLTIWRDRVEANAIRL